MVVQVLGAVLNPLFYSKRFEYTQVRGVVLLFTIHHKMGGNAGGSEVPCTEIKQFFLNSSRTHPYQGMCSTVQKQPKLITIAICGGFLSDFFSRV